MKSGVLTADYREHLLAALNDNVAEVATVEEGTPFTLRQDKAGICGVCVLSEPLPKGSLCASVFCQSVLVNADFPADTAVVAALVGNASEVLVIVRVYVQ